MFKNLLFHANRYILKYITICVLLFPSQIFAQTIDSVKSKMLDEIVVSASRIKEKYLKSPTSIELLTLKQIQQSPTLSYFDAIENMRGIQLITPSLGFRVYNARGFTNTTNVRFVQLVDGIDNQAPHIGSPVASAMTPNDLDIHQVEMIPGVASALYGMNSLNGLVNLITINPFESEGLSIQQKTGINHINNEHISPKLFTETSLRFAKKLNEKWAFKTNFTYQKGYDWMASSTLDLNPTANTSVGLIGKDNVGADYVNSYGNESSNRRTLTLNGKKYVVARTGYFEEEVTDYSINNIKGDFSVNYRLKPNHEISYIFKYAQLDNVYQRTNRFRLDNYRLSQNAVVYQNLNTQLKLYLTAENTGKSYNIRSMAENIDRNFKSDNVWFTDFTNKYNNQNKQGKTIIDALNSARNFADKGRPQPNTQQFNDLITKLGDINNWDNGAALRVKSYLLHTEGLIDLSHKFLPDLQKNGFGLLAGFDYRNYFVIPDGNYFINPKETGKNLTYWKTGGFVQLSKKFLDEKIKVIFTLRGDKNQYFNLRFNPRGSMVYSLNDNNHFRLNYQNGYRFPSLFEAFSNINSGGVKRVGGLPIMSQGIFENSYLRKTIDDFTAAVNQDININKLSQNEAILKNKNILRKNDYTYLQPEYVNSFEIGYKGYPIGKRLFVDADFYYNVYRNFMAQIEANVPTGTNTDSLAFYMYDRNKQARYRLWTNSKTIVRNFGGGVSLAYNFYKNFTIISNTSFAKLKNVANNDGFEEAFNTPRWIINVGINNSTFTKNIGFSVNYKYQESFLWQSALATGIVPKIHNFDAQLTYNLRKQGIQIKLAGTNMLNRQYVSFVAGPTIGAFYYSTITFNNPFK
ncbi:Vitamin B12 transporter BtuB [Emticicia aquatica]|uniref:Vitamin B12 transporter BtuB n=1 Tax=Emticicia aquatica TaxID=1681835 RepID=A0ABM9AW78_9BACT|nr:TonB-dependent receptor [Emticicia aquatica]CAH0997704.1 Vitamin B12 transporter BtuB [Emticicia aquatica]